MRYPKNSWRKMAKYSRNVRLGFVNGLPIFIVIAVLSLMVTTKMYAQTDSVRWSLTSTINPDIFGNLAAGAETYSNMVHRSYNSGVCEKTAPDAAGTWAAETDINVGRYDQFAVSPASGFNFNVTSIKMFIGWSGTTDHLYAKVFYSTDSTFTTKTQLGGTIAILNTTYSLSSFSLSVLVNNGSAFYLRIYPWNNSAATGKNCGLFDVSISGTTASTSTTSLSVSPGSLSFGSINPPTIRIETYSLSGSLLTPSNGNIIITAPTGYTVSTSIESGYTSSLTVPYSGGTLNSTTIYTKFTPTAAITYSGMITNAGGGAVTQSVSVTGAGTLTITGIFVSLTGSDSNPGTADLPFLTIQKAVSVAQPGDRIYVRSGRYSVNSTITISTSGTSINHCYLWGYPGDETRPILDFSTEAFGSRGISLTGSYWHIKGIEVYKAGDNGLYIGGSNNIIEVCSFYENQDSGLQLAGGASYNQVINCDSYFNADPTDYGDADGFACKMDVSTGNYFNGCRSWLNVDDGWDGYMRGASGVSTTLENCWTWRNGYFKNGTDAGSNANGNGFKLGGSDTKNLVHNFTLKNCLSFQNKGKGFDQNSNAGSITLYNCTAYNNVGQDYMLNSSGVTYDPTSVFTVKNCIALGSSGTSFKAGTILSNNNFSTTNSAYLSIDTSGITGPRKSDGSLPDIAFMHLACGTTLIDAGTNVGLPFNGSAPDLGAFESSCSGTNYTLTITATNGSATKSPDQTSYASGTSVQLTAVPAIGYHFTSWSGDLTGSTNPTTVTMSANKTITANFAINVYTITATAGTNGTVTPAGVTTVNYNGSQNYAIAPDAGYHVSHVLVDGSTVGAVSSYNFTNVTVNHTLSASFALSIPEIPVATAPTNIDSTSYTAHWNASIGATSYQLDVAADSLFNIPIIGYIGLNATGTSQVVTGLTPITVYYYRLRASNAAGSSSNSNTITVGTTSSIRQEIMVPVSSGWNFVAVPLMQADYTASMVFPGMFGSMFGFNTGTGSYVEAATLEPGHGYWVYYTSGMIVTFNGSTTGPLILPCAAGWNLLGSRNIPVSVSALQVSGGEIFGSVFRYNALSGSYEETLVITPGEARWVYVTQPCTITIP
jgi:hypothetical protein